MKIEHIGLTDAVFGSSVQLLQKENRDIFIGDDLSGEAYFLMLSCF